MDPPNIVSLIGLLCAVAAIYAAILGKFPIAIDANLDSLIDIISFGVFPGLFLLSYRGFGGWFLSGGFVLAAVAVVRLSYFNVFGLVDKKPTRAWRWTIILSSWHLYSWLNASSNDRPS